jgi:hypothetical protein
MVYDPALYEQDHYQQYLPQPQYQEYQYQMPQTPIYYDISGAGQEYAVPVTYEPQILPDGQSLDDLPQEYNGDVEELVEQWVQMEEDTGEMAGIDGEWTMQAPDLAVSDWDNLDRTSLPSPSTIRNELTSSRRARTDLCRPRLIPYYGSPPHSRPCKSRTVRNVQQPSNGPYSHV